jgi:glycosyltransferase involved in cell wall biosynthesis
MKVGIYQNCWGWIGGAQYYAGVVAEALGREHEVEVVHHRADFRREEVEEAFGLDLSPVAFRRVAELPARRQPGKNPIARYRRERAWCAELSRPYDLFLSDCGVPLFCHAPRGVVLVHFPYMDRDAFHGRVTPDWSRRPSLERAAARLYHAIEWSRRYSTYQLTIANSFFTRRWIRDRWGVDATVVYPPARSGFRPGRKEKVILGVGRFNPEKRQDALIAAFRRGCDVGLEGWRLVLAGSYREAAENAEFLRELRRLAEGYPVEIAPNLPGAELNRLFESASIYWHAMGYGVDESHAPERMEHFGIVTVEAMAAGCVPIVFAGGGQPEIVRHLRDGFLWWEPSDLVDQTMSLAADPGRLALLSATARGRAREFSKEAFASRFLEATSFLMK